MTPPRRAKLVLLVLAVALVGLGVWAWEPLWMWATTKTVTRPPATRNWDGLRVRSYAIVKRWRDFPPERTVEFYEKTGFKSMEVEWRAAPFRWTTWNVDGSVAEQNQADIDGHPIIHRDSPPWLWGVTDQTEPTMPAWMKDDAQWQAALDAQE